MNEFLLTQNILREYLIKNGCKMNKGFGPISIYMKWLRRKTKKINMIDANIYAIIYFNNNRIKCLRKFNRINNLYHKY